MSIIVNYPYNGITIPGAFIRVHNISTINTTIVNIKETFSKVSFEVRASEYEPVITYGDMMFEPNLDLPLWQQAYDKLKELYPNSTNI